MHSLEHALVAWDRSTMIAINHGLKSPLLDVLMPHISDLGLGHVQVFFVLGMALALGLRRGEIRLRSLLHDAGQAIRKRRVWVGPLLVAFALSGLLSTAVKNTTSRDRPWQFYSLQHMAGRMKGVMVYTAPGRPPMKTRGFLSGHTATTLAMTTAFTAVFGWRRRTRWAVSAAWALAPLISLSRIYIAEHWPIDVVAGAILGVASGCAAVAICRWWSGRAVGEEAAGSANSQREHIG